MTFTRERFEDVTFFRLNGVTRVIWFSRSYKTRVFRTIYRDGIVVFAVFGYCVVLAPFAKTK